MYCDCCNDFFSAPEDEWEGVDEGRAVAICPGCQEDYFYAQDATYDEDIILDERFSTDG